MCQLENTHVFIRPSPYKLRLCNILGNPQTAVGQCWTNNWPTLAHPPSLLISICQSLHEHRGASIRQARTRRRSSFRCHAIARIISPCPCNPLCRNISVKRLRKLQVSRGGEAIQEGQLFCFMRSSKIGLRVRS